MSKAKLRYRKVLLKISGEGLAGSAGFGIDADQLALVAREVGEVVESGVQVGIVVGGGNLVRGAALAGKSAIPEATAHHIGMLATVMNSLALQETLEATGVPARVMSSVAIASICEPYSRRGALDHLAQGRVVILGAGTGRPFVTTDTAAALGAVEIGADAMLKATQVDGVYSADPKTNPDADFYPTLTYDRVIDERLRVMDISAVDLCQRQNLPIVVFNLHQPGNMRRVVTGETIGTVVTSG